MIASLAACASTTATDGVPGASPVATPVGSSAGSTPSPTVSATTMTSATSVASSATTRLTSVADTNSSEATDGLAHYGVSLLKFSYPAAWTPTHFDVVFSFSDVEIYLSTMTLHDPCVRTQDSLECGQPVDHLDPGAVLITWERNGMAHAEGGPVIGAPNTVIDGDPADVNIVKGATPCNLSADEAITAEIARPRLDKYDITACLRAPGLEANEQAVLAMLNSVVWNLTPG